MSVARMRRAPTHPGVIFRLDYREPLGISQAEAARQLSLTPRHLNEIEKGKRAVTARTAVYLAAATGTSAEFWATLQMRHELWHEMQAMGAITIGKLKKSA